MKKLFVLLFFLLAHTLVTNAQDSTLVSPTTLHHMQVRELDLYKKNVDDKVAAHNTRLDDLKDDQTTFFTIVGLVIAFLTAGLTIATVYAINNMEKRAKEVKESYEKLEAKLTKDFSTHENTIKDKIEKLDKTISTQEKRINQAVKKALDAEKRYENTRTAMAKGEPLTPEQEATKVEMTKDIEAKKKSEYTANDWFLKGYEAQQKGDYKEACEYYEKATILNPEHAEAFNNWGNALANLEKHDKAIEKYKKAIEIRPNFASAYNNWAYALNTFNTKEAFEEAIIQAKKAVELNSKSPNAPDTLGNAYLGLGQYDKACDSYYTAIDLKPDYLEAYTHYDKALDGLKETDPKLYPDKVEVFKTLLEKNKNLPELKDNKDFEAIYKKHYGS